MKPILIVTLLSLTISTFAQEEGHASVKAINSNVLTLNNCTDADNNFRVNQKVIVIQKEGNSLAFNTNYKAAKNGATKQVARKYVVLTITEVERSAEQVTSIKVSRDLQSSFIVNNIAAVDVRIVSCKWNW